MNLLIEMFAYDFMLRALVVGVAIALVAALIGVPLVLRRSSMIGDGLSHAAFGACALALAVGVMPTIPALIIVLLASFLILQISRNRKIYSDALIAILSVSSLAIGVLAISLAGGINIDLNSYLFGSILSVGYEDVAISLILALIVVILYIVLFKKIFAVTFDAEFAKSIDIKVNLYDAIFAAICSVVVVIGMKLLGALLVSGLIIFPALIAMRLVKTFRGVVVAASVISIVGFLLGLILSYVLALPTGATIVAVDLIFLLLAIILDRCC
ncbi:metal ABC transporter permease [Candidatus Saccharibacteria bacterium]|nr:metal ABC transporter permease [Candidatus Saccharibacteria bacterium]